MQPTLSVEQHTFLHHQPRSCPATPPLGSRRVLVASFLLLATVACSATAGEALAQPASTCPGNCTSYGTCNEELGRCDCPKDRTGADCSEALASNWLAPRCEAQGYGDIPDCLSRAQSCINACNYRGKCVSGWCHCKPGYYGSDCALSLDAAAGKPQLLAGQGYATRAKRPWVYVYDLPPHLSSWHNFRRLDRPTHNMILQRLLGSGARVADGDLADWYYIPILLRSNWGTQVLPEAVDYVRAHYPWYNRTGGSRHFIVHTGDWGRAETPPWVQRAGENLTWLTHWGLTKDRPEARWLAAHRPQRDVVIPVYISSGHFKNFGMLDSPLHPRYNGPTERNLTLFFAGRICDDRQPPDTARWPSCRSDDLTYSAGVRQKVHFYHWNRTGFHIVQHEPNYGVHMRQSKYCLAPTGAGHGQRQIQSLFVGCVPVSIADMVCEPFEPIISWNDFGVRVAEGSIPRLHQVLAAIGDEEYEAKQARVRCAAQHMVYSSVTGGFMNEDGRFDAFETILEVLRVKAAFPDAPPEQYRALDKDFDDFMACRKPEAAKSSSTDTSSGATAGGASTGDGAAGAAEQHEQEGPRRGHWRLCSHASYELRSAGRHCYKLLRGSGYFGIPGGAMCARRRRQLSRCPRVWK